MFQTLLMPVFYVLHKSFYEKLPRNVTKFEFSFIQRTGPLRTMSC